MKNHLKIVSVFIVFTCFILTSSSGRTQESEVVVDIGRTLKTSWETWYPYEYLKNPSIPTSLTGLDIQLVKTLAKKVDQKVEFQPMDWDSTLLALKNGELDFASGATYSKEREAYLTYSKPYRFEEDSLFVLRTKLDHYPFQTIFEFQAFIQKNNFRLGVKKGAIYADQKINDFIADPKNAQYIIYTKDEMENLNKLLGNEIDGYFADRIAGSALVWHTENGKFIAEKDLNIKTPIYLIFSKKTVSNKTVSVFNKAIDNLNSGEEYKNIISWYLYPVILLQTLDTNWFHLIDILGTLFFSISGVLIANSLNGSLLSALIYAVLASMGGGLLRDILFGQRPVEVLTTPLYITIVCSTVLIGFFIVKFFDKIEKINFSGEKPLYYKKIYAPFRLALTICDALGLAAFTVTGVMISLMAKVQPLWLWGPFFSFVTGAAGTIIRDILSKSRKISDIEGEIYSEVAIVWGLFLSLGLLYNTYHINPDLIKSLVLITIVGAFTTRLLIYFFKVPNVYFKSY